MTAPVSRRDVLAGALKGTGALLVGFAMSHPLTALAARITDDVENDIAGINKRVVDGDRVDAWLVITRDGRMILYSGKVELGTGVATALRQIVAEELAIAPTALEFIQGDTELTPDQKYTAGSKTLQVGGKQLRRAAATARHVLLGRASEHLGVPVEGLTVFDGAVVVTMSPSQRLSYAELIGTGFDTAVNDQADTVAPENFRVVGRSAPRIDIPAKVSGDFTYVHDIKRPGMWHGRVVRPPTIGATRMTATPEHIDRRHLAAEVEVVVEGAFIGVVAPTEWGAMQAAQSLKVSWRYAPTLPRMEALFDTLEAMPGDEEVGIDVGDVDTRLAAAEAPLTATYRWPYQIHDSIGPSCAVAEVNEGRMTAWSATQGVYPLRASLADLLELPQDEIHVIYAEGAGCYGHNGADDVTADAALLARAVNRPVRVQWSRADEHGWGPKGPAMVMKMAGALDASNAIAAWTFENWSPTHTTRPNADDGAANVLAGQLAHGLTPGSGTVGGNRNARTLYTFPHQRVTTHWLSSESSPLRPSALRTLGAMQNTFANECFLDELAYAGGLDPVDVRLRYLNDPRAKAVIEAVAKRSGWQPREQPNGQYEASRASHGRGIAFAQYENECAYVAAIAEVAVSGQGVRVEKVTVAHDCGQIVNPDGLRNQIEGNVLQATSRVLKEEVGFNTTGVTSLEWGAYPLLTFAEIPKVDIVLLDRPSEPMLGAGEATSAVIPAAIANAVFDACGLRLRRAPLTAAELRRVAQQS
ncbi:xanthine dehydrogenase family protein molybdopterin-binding subunit [Phytohalomonas tamaricis]|uniref:xanthine dehydrogenase family protein molybdopterin-binding subunit n=1 Tax=Phytohalomonas tamaricis TaxID=2081032 RepID=UPI000D0B7A50|nr:molybdopterin cofactor-binding domain-containing protein [Phytohalomonas tamaricis]